MNEVRSCCSRMRIGISLKWLGFGFVLGIAATAALLGWYEASPTNILPLRLVRAVAWLGFFVFDRTYQGYTANVNLRLVNALLILLGGVQWAVLTLIAAYIEPLVRRTGT
jgi:hypothetical protein